MSDPRASVTISAVDEASATLKKVRDNFEGMIAPVDKLKGALGGLAAAAGVNWAVGFIEGGIKAMAEMKHLSDKTGATVEALSAMKSVAKMSGTDLESVGGGLQKLSKSMLEAATSGGKTGDIFKSLKVSVADASGGLRNSEIVMQEVAQKLASMESGTQRVAYAQALFGKSGAQLLPFLMDLARHGELVGKITTEQAEQAEKLEKAWIKLGGGMGRIKMDVATALMPAMEDGTRAIQRISEQMKEGIKVAGGFGEAIVLLGTINPFRSTGGNIKSLTKEIDDLEAKKREAQAIGPSFDFGSGTAPESTGDIDAKIERAKKQREFLKLQQRQEALSLLDGKNGALDAKGPRVTPYGKYGLPQSDAAKESTSAYDALIRSIREKTAAEQAELDGGQKLTAAQQIALKVMVDIRDGAVKLTEAQKRGVAANLEELLSVDSLSEAKKAAAAADRLVAQFREESRHELAKIEQAGNAASLSGVELKKMVERNAEIERAYRKIAAAQNNATLSDKERAEDIRKINEELKEQLPLFDATTQKAWDKARSWQSGVTKGMRDYLDAVTDDAAKMQRVVSDAFKGMEDALLKFVRTGKLDFKSLANSIVDDIIRIQIQRNITGPLAEAMSKPKDWAGGGGILSGIGDFFGGLFRADGGPVSANSPYIVGERGPELFVPGAGGAIVPNNALGGGGDNNVTINFNVQAIDAASFRSSLAANQNVIIGVVRQAFTKRAITSPI